MRWSDIIAANRRQNKRPGQYRRGYHGSALARTYLDAQDELAPRRGREALSLAE